MPKSRRIEKVLLVNPRNSIHVDSARRLTTPLGLLQMAGTLRESGYDVSILDSTEKGYFNVQADPTNKKVLHYGLDDPSLVSEIRRYNPDVVGITSMFSAQHSNTMYTAALIKRELGDLPIVVGGIHPSLPEFTPHVIRDPNIDYVVMGEGELRIVALMNAIKEGKNPEFDGVAYKKESGDVEIITNRQIKARGGLVGNLEGYVRFDELPLPARDLIDMERYFEIGVPMGPFTHGYRPDQIMTSRGCPYECNFCATVEYWGRLMRNRSPENVLREVDDLVKRYGVDEIQWADDNLTARSREAKQIFNGLIERGYPLKWATPNGLMLRSMFEKNGEGPVDNEMVDLMARSGAYQVTFAVESGSQRVLRDIVHKPVPEQHRVRDLVDRIHGTGVKVHGMFIVGFPGEKPEEVEMTLRYPAETGFDSASIFIACPMPGSRLYDEAKREGWITDELIGGDLKTAHMTIPRSDPRFVMEKEELEELVDKRLKEFNALRLQKDPEWHEKKFRVYREKQQAIRKKYGPTAGDTIDIYGRVT